MAAITFTQIACARKPSIQQARTSEWLIGLGRLLAQTVNAMTERDQILGKPQHFSLENPVRSLSSGSHSAVLAGQA
ncbi:MAG: hypothetical protein K2Y20_00650 [Sphingomonas sp.]|nr:hypothetical protein [Sphingomonas sp.]